jgi:predicted unusual protein kinase regulating ubiquinone biosynthesis (AarF/ABC1/UbiB family)
MGYAESVPAAREKTEELTLDDLVQPPPLPGREPPVRPPVAAPPPDRTPAGRRRPRSRLFRAYAATFQIALSYAWLALQRRFRTPDRMEALTTAAHRRNAHRAREAIVDLQGLFIKVGQLISIMANFLPEAFRRELEGLQDQVPPRPYADIEARLREEFGGRAPSEVFAEFDPDPIASASIGQVHVARLHTGEKVAVKVQYPDIEEIVRTDLRALRRIFGLLGHFMPEWGFDTIYREIREMVLAELDYRSEADAVRRIGANFKSRPDVLTPHVIGDHSTTRVLTLQWMDGTKIADLDGLAAEAIDRKRAARLVVEAYCQQIFIDGIYHADPHPGNLLLRAGAGAAGGPTLVFLDFGATAQVSQGMRKGMVSFLQGAITRDTGRIVSAMKEMGFISRRADPEVFDRVVAYFHDRLRSQLRMEGFSLKDIRFEPEAKLASLLDLRELNVSLSDLRDAFHVPKEWVLLERTLLLLLGVCTTLDPEMNPLAAIQPYVEKFMLGEKKQWSEAFVEASREAAFSALTLPAELGRFLAAASRGDLGVRPAGLEEGVRALYAVFQQLLWGGLGASAAALAVVFDGRGQTTARSLAIAAGMLCGLLLTGSLIRGARATRARPRR